MADKEASIYIVDLGESMADCNNGRTESDLDWSMRYVWDKIASTVQASRKTWCVGVIGLRTDETQNKYGEGEGYDNISVIQPLGPMVLPQLKDLRDVMKPSNTSGGDAMSAVIVAAEMMDELTKKNKWNRKIYLVTDGQGPIDGDDVDEISGRLNELGIELIVIGVDFDDPEYGFKEEDKPRLKAQNEAILESLVKKCQKALFGTMAEAVAALDTPRVKPVKLVRNYDGPLTLGNADQFESAIRINVERWPVTKVSRPSAATTVVLKSEPNATQSTQTLGDEMEGLEYGDSTFNQVKQHRTYKVNDPSAPGGKMDVEFEELAKGYLYGSTAVHLADSEWDITDLGSTKSFSIIGFIPNDRFEPFLGLGETSVTVARPYDDESKLALSALIHALWELETCAVARFVVKDGKDPVLLVLRPSIEPDLECLFDVPLPFAEDVRSYRFPPLDKVVTVTGKTLTKNRLLPGDKLKQAMSDFVDAMDLSECDIDDEGNPAEYAPLDALFSPIIHRINQAIRARAVDPDGPVEEIPPTLLKYSQPPDRLIEEAKPQIEALISAADVKKVLEKAKGKHGRPESAKPLSAINIDDLLDPPTEISKENSIPEFKHIVRRLRNEVDSEQGMENAVKSMGQIIQGLITESMGDNNYDRALENIGVLRGECVGFEVPGLYNNFLRDLKKKISSGALGGDRRHMWQKIRWAGNLGLIHKNQSEASDVTEDEARQFWRTK